jgi:hypothetical protein
MATQLSVQDFCLPAIAGPVPDQKTIADFRRQSSPLQSIGVPSAYSSPSVLEVAYAHVAAIATVTASTEQKVQRKRRRQVQPNRKQASQALGLHQEGNGDQLRLILPHKEISKSSMSRSGASCPSRCLATAARHGFERAGGSDPVKPLATRPTSSDVADSPISTRAGYTAARSLPSTRPPLKWSSRSLASKRPCARIDEQHWKLEAAVPEALPSHAASAAARAWLEL